ncbi:MAG: hypothetical protein Q4D58_04470 [Synergistaceae bacterium]|nr:hypothetical protein [Synergistaceae bacterium]
MDIKIKLEDSTLGAERWKPVFKTPFPPALSAFSAITGYMGAPMHVSLADGVLPRGAHIATVEAEKERDIYMVKDAIIEYGSVSFGKRRMWSLCAESAELSQVEYFISGCRIKNVMTASYVTMLKHFLNW